MHASPVLADQRCGAPHPLPQCLLRLLTLEDTPPVSVGTVRLRGLGFAMGRYGTGTGVLAAFLAGAGGNVAAWLASLEQHRNLGASGMVMGSLGLLAAQSPSL